jgi:hypothetical protein
MSYLFEFLDKYVQPGKMAGLALAGVRSGIKIATLSRRIGLWVKPRRRVVAFR